MTRLSDRFRSTPYAIAAAIGLLAIGGGAGAGAMYAARPVEVMAPGAPVAIATLAAAKPLFGEEIATVRGRVAEIYGGRFVLVDGSGRALVETGRHGRDAPVAAGQTVTVQGRYGDGVLHAAFLVGADGKVSAFHPGRPGGPDDRGPGHRGPRDHGPEDRGPEDRGPGDRGPGDRGPDDRGPGGPGPSASPAAPAGAGRQAPPAPAAATATDPAA